MPSTSRADSVRPWRHRFRCWRSPPTRFGRLGERLPDLCRIQIRTTGVFTSNDFDVIRGLVKEKLGLAIVPVLAIGIDRSIQLRRIGPIAPRRRVYAAYRKSDTNPLIGAAIQALGEASDDFLAWTSRAFSSRLDSPIAIFRGSQLLKRIRLLLRPFATARATVDLTVRRRDSDPATLAR
ncbi:hypothetical protein EEB14_01700 [Rhodococcus sp. WS4]|nr:hypothetical protein EEB14_01700 [Rhodococcus sp. WS4]